jgi:magnesium-transporting ATPase (P-type)
MEALKDIIPDETRVIRQENDRTSTTELVPGDVVLLEAETESPLMFVLLKPIN